MCVYVDIGTVSLISSSTSMTKKKKTTKIQKKTDTYLVDIEVLNDYILCQVILEKKIVLGEFQMNLNSTTSGGIHS